jgi:hypothetical protein
MPVVGVHTSRYVGDGDTCFGRRLLRARDGDETGLALDEQVVGLLVPVRPRSAVAGDVAHDEPRVVFTQCLRPEAETLRCARGEVLDEDVGLFQKAVRACYELD